VHVSDYFVMRDVMTEACDLCFSILHSSFGRVSTVSFSRSELTIEDV
jgi:hypothetical protein